MTRTFEIGKTYTARSACDHDCIFSYEVVARTAKTVTLRDKFGEIRRRGIRVSFDSEICFPQGSFSMAPVLSAERS